MIVKFFPEEQDSRFYSLMGKYFADKNIIKEMDCQLYNDINTTWIIEFDNKTGEVLGFLSIQNKDKYYYIDNFYVIKEYRNKGIGRNLLSHVFLLLLDKPIRLITRNEYAEKLFEQRGFKTYAQHGRYKKMEYNF